MSPQENDGRNDFLDRIRQHEQDKSIKAQFAYERKVIRAFISARNRNQEGDVPPMYIRQWEEDNGGSLDLPWLNATLDCPVKLASAADGVTQGMLRKPDSRKVSRIISEPWDRLAEEYPGAYRGLVVRNIGWSEDWILHDFLPIVRKGEAYRVVFLDGQSNITQIHEPLKQFLDILMSEMWTWDPVL